MAKRALLIGIDYKNSSNKLKGCINDVINMKKELMARGYPEDNIVIMTDDTDDKPTKENILREFEKLVKSGIPTLFFHYSGHGSSTRDRSGDEEDGRDECLVPIDYKKNGVIVDDHLKAIVMKLKRGQVLSTLVDACHSGTVFDLKYPLTVEDVQTSCCSSTKKYRMIPNHKEQTNGQCIVFSGCLDKQTSADSFINLKHQGAMTYAFIHSINKKSVKTRKQLFKAIRSTLEKGLYSQIPQLSSGRPLDLDAKYTL